MAKLELNVGEKVPTVVEVKPVLEAAPVVPTVKQRTASGWHIVAGKEKNSIVATSNMGDKFSGTIKDFNKLLRS